MISTSEIKISCVIEQPQVEDAVRVLHRRFKLEEDQVELGRPFLLAPEEVGARPAAKRGRKPVKAGRRSTARRPARKK